MGGSKENYPTSTPTVLVLFFCLLVLICMLIFLYKKLNKENDGEYTIRRIVYKEGGLRDRVRGAVMVLETRLGVQLWPHNNSGEDGEEMQEIQDEEGQVEHSSQQSDGEKDEQEEEDNGERSSETEGKGDDTSDDNSSFQGSDSEEQANLMEHPEAKEETGERGKEKGGDGDGKDEASGGGGLQINISQFSGSAIWSEEEGGEANINNVTAL